MYRMNIAAVALLLAACCVPGCTESIASPSTATSQAGSAPAELTITDTLWKLQSFQRSDSTPVAVPDSERFTLELRADGRMSVRADCNRCSGSYRVDGETLVLGTNAACTRAYCASAPFDQQYVEAISGAAVTRAAGNTLKAVSPAGVLIFAH
jgi:heat shock protein HslJ